MGLNQSVHGTDKNLALINLHLATGQIGKPGAGPFSALYGNSSGGVLQLWSADGQPDDPWRLRATYGSNATANVAVTISNDGSTAR